MRKKILPGMAEATRLTRAGRLGEALSVIQRVVRGERPAPAEPAPAAPAAKVNPTPLRALPGGAARAAPAETAASAQPSQAVKPSPAAKPSPAVTPVEAVGRAGLRPAAPAWTAGAAPRPAAPEPRMIPMPHPEGHRPLAEGLRPLAEGLRPLPQGLREIAREIGRKVAPLLDGLVEPAPDAEVAGEAGPGEFLSRHYANAAGQRAYKLYVPGAYRGRAVPLVVMLHGCTQSPDDFAAGTGMNRIADAETFLVAYPAQTAAANHARCWNWFNSADQRRDHGEASLIAGIARAVMEDYAVDPRRVYVAGLSAGGAAAANLAAAYPDLFAAVGIHSGLCAGAASGLPAAMRAMREGAEASSRPERVLPTIVFHGDQDTTVHPRNGAAIIAATGGTLLREEAGVAPNGRAWRRSVLADESGRPRFEHWVVQGSGHAWSGGDAAASYTDPSGPDASREMWRFFLENPKPRR
ncbi:esterase, PHB depolymerase family [Methylobacterium sp. 4-46]|uniref:extracellular catalytic domain type 1 short-chain-length polyhydroxyalkanoate depolymerase n=1 Tax=unclassified Methylobacterium TaxID=2615210 RepID=UPI000152D910|nr:MULTISPECIES: PHB depolymerase family esterase [Methylobacterium]ACA20507.1 esterase, PHB depolymerase family [Methylobacterium sp. 4-46]WFT79672.1 PHB depolymerase family esterase [Methylobacterium nodulans]